MKAMVKVKVSRYVEMVRHNPDGTTQLVRVSRTGKFHELYRFMDKDGMPPHERLRFQLYGLELRTIELKLLTTPQRWARKNRSLVRQLQARHHQLHRILLRFWRKYG